MLARQRRHLLVVDAAVLGPHAVLHGMEQATENDTAWPWVRCPPWARLIPRSVAPGSATARYAARFAEAPECACTLAWAAPNSLPTRSSASSSATSTNSQPP